MVSAKVKLPFPCLCLVTNRGLFPDGSHTERIERAVQGGVGMVQVREKDMPGGLMLAMTREIKERVGDRAVLIVNERLDVAMAAGAHGIHLGEAAIPVSQARKVVGNGMLIGRSVHSFEMALQAQDEGADYLIVGTLFPTRSKPGKEPEGLDLLRKITARIHIPALGIGGITVGNVGMVMECGATGAAVITAVLAAQDPREAARQLVTAMRAHAAASKAERW